MRRLHFAALLTVFALGATTSAEAGMVTVNSTGIAVRAQPDFLTAPADDLYTGTVIDGADYNISASIGGASSDGTIKFSESATQTVFDMSFTQARSGVIGGSYTYAFGGFLFTADEAGLTYSLDGAYSSENGYTILAVSFYDQTAGSASIFNSAQSAFAGGGSFVLGGTDGDAYSLTGNQAGSLIAGHQYRIHIDLLSQDASLEGSDGGADSEGFVRLTVSRQAAEPVPEPASLSLFGLGALGLAGVRLRRSPPPELKTSAQTGFFF